MARYCPLKDGPALYLDCKECNERACENVNPGRTYRQASKPSSSTESVGKNQAIALQPSDNHNGR